MRAFPPISFRDRQPERFVPPTNRWAVLAGFLEGAPNLTLNYGVRYDIEFPPKFKAPKALALAAYRRLGLQKGIQTDSNNIQPRIGMAWDPREMARALFALLTESSMTILCSACISSVTRRMVRAAAS